MKAYGKWNRITVKDLASIVTDGLIGGVRRGSDGYGGNHWKSHRGIMKR